jgi:hypothetical protein
MASPYPPGSRMLCSPRQEAAKHTSPGGYWIGDSISKLMNAQSFIGIFSSNPAKNKPTLGQVLYSEGHGYDQQPVISDHEFGEIEGNFSFENGEPERKKILKEIGILIHSEDHSRPEAGTITVSTLSLHADLGTEPFYWLGSAPDTGSLELLELLLSMASSVTTQKVIITTVGLHPSSLRQFRFLRSILTGAGQESIREEAAFWLGDAVPARHLVYWKGQRKRTDR